jgi:ubiquitin-like protein ATG12
LRDNIVSILGAPEHTQYQLRDAYTIHSALRFLVLKSSHRPVPRPQVMASTVPAEGLLASPPSSTTTSGAAPPPGGGTGLGIGLGIANDRVDKVKVHFVSVGAAPIMKRAKFQISADQRFASVHAFLRKVLKVREGDSLFLYLHAAFCPGPEELVGDLNDCFSKRGELVIHYSLQQAWG